MIYIPSFRSKQKLIYKCLLIAFIYGLLTASCTYQNSRSAKRLKELAAMADSNPGQALAEFSDVSADELTKDDYYYYLLVKTRLLRQNGLNISDMHEQVNHAIDYYTDRGNYQMLAFGYFVSAKVYEANNDKTKAISSYLNADWYADKAGNKLPDFVYANIPYNIALYYKKEGDFRSSQDYLNKALAFVDEYNGSRCRQFSLELSGVNYMYLNMPDSAFHYYNAASDIATRLKDSAALLRITCNRIETLADLEDTNYAEAKSKELMVAFEPTADSTFIGLTNLSFAKLYIKIGNLKKADECITNAQKHLSNTDISVQVQLHEQLVLLNQLQGNRQQLIRHQEQLSKLSSTQSSNQLVFLQEVQAALKKREGELLSENMKLREATFFSIKEKQQQLMISLIFGFVLLGTLVAAIPVSRVANNLRKHKNIVYYIISKYQDPRTDPKAVELVESLALSKDEQDKLFHNLAAMRVNMSLFLGLEPFKRKLFGKDFTNAVPCLISETELEYCYLMNTCKYSVAEIMRMLKVDAFEHHALQLAFEEKMQQNGYKLPSGYLKMKIRQQ